MLVTTLNAPKSNGNPVPPTLQVTVTAPVGGTLTVTFVLVDEASGTRTSLLAAFNNVTNFWEASTANKTTSGHFYTVIASATWVNGANTDSGSDAKIHCKAP
jgi:hypothetical protein